MTKKILYTITALSIFLSACAQTKPAATQVTEEAIAFPGAEGFGKFTTGGRGGKVLTVTNLNDSGEGSFRKAAEAKYPRVIVFAVSGTIHLGTKLNIAGDATIAGQTAPGDGICIADQPVSLNGNNIIVRYMRFRMGDKYQNAGQVQGSGSDDAFGGTGRKNIIIDHCSMSWSTDEVFSVYNGDSTTLQWNLITEPLNYSYHFETGDKDFENHGYGGIWGGKHLTAHHNLFAHCVSRNPRFNGIRHQGEELVDYTNNVIYNWGSNNVYGGEGGNYNITNNYYRPGPMTSKSVLSRIVNPLKLKSPFIDFGKYYVNGNYTEADAKVTADNKLGVHLSDGTDEDKKNSIVANAFTSIRIQSETAEQAYENVLKHVGASFVRDTMDIRIINDVKNKKGKFVNVQGDFPHGTSYEQTVTAWPALKTLPALADSDKDGMPDEWETKNGLNASNAGDASSKKLHDHYTNVEVYINSIIKK
jgi:pectate lyase